jgi:hypothetical protein
MSIYEFNMNALKTRYPDLAEKLRHLKDDYSVKTIPSGNPPFKTCVVKHGDQEWLLHCKENPRAEAQSFANNVLGTTINDANVLVFLGIGMGYYVDAVFSRYASNLPYVIIVENNLHIFKNYIQNSQPMVTVDGKQISIFAYEGCHLSIGVPIDQVYAQLYNPLNMRGKQSFTTFSFVEHPVEIRFNKDYYKPFCKEVARVCYDIKSSYGNDPEDSWFGIDHMLQNLDLIAAEPGVEKVKDKFKGQPAVIVATGPSLDKNIHLLPKLKNRCVFFAADASLNTFTTYDPPIVPDIVCSLERNLSTCNHFKQIEDKDSMKGIFLGACPVVKPHVYREWHGDHMVVFRDFAHFKWLKLDKGILNTGKSVTNMAFKIAEYMGCDPIILVGQDLAFAPGGESHVSGADHARKGLKDSQLIKQKAKVMGNSGEMLDSLETWVGMLKRFEFDIATKPRPYTVINATEGGARIKGTEIMTLQGCIDKYMQKDIATGARLREFLAPLSAEVKENNTKTINTEINRGLEYLDWSIKELEAVLDALEEGSSFFEDNKVDPRVDELFQYAEKVKNELLQHEMCYFTIMHVIQSWCMGRENALKGLPSLYKGDEYIVARYIKIFEFFFGLLKLYRHVCEGTRKNFYGSPKAESARGQAVQQV